MTTPKRKKLTPAAVHVAAALAPEVEPAAAELMTAERVEAPIVARFDIQLGIDDIATVGAVEKEHRLADELKEQVREVHRLNDEIGVRTAKLATIFAETAIDPAFTKKCDALVAAAEALGIRFTADVTKGSFNPDTLAYSVSVKFRGEPSATTSHTIASEHARELVTEAADLRRQHTAAVKHAEVIKKELDPAKLARESKANVVKTLLNGTGEGATVLHAMSEGQGQRQLGAE